MSGAHPAYGSLRAVTPLAAVVLQDNPSPMTLEGTNTWVLRAPDARECVVVDPGDDDEAHQRRVAAHGPVALVLLTHRHHDHAAGARRFAELTGAPVRALDPSLVLGSEALGDGDVVAAAGCELRVVATPGHTSDSLSFLLDGPGTAGPAVLTGDTVLGRGVGEFGAVSGQDHREERLEQVRDALRVLGSAATARQVVERVYADVDRVLWPAAEASVRAQLAYLRG